MIQLTENLYAVKVPADASEFKLNDHFTFIQYKHNSNVHHYHLEDNRCKYSILGTVKKYEIDFDVFNNLGITSKDLRKHILEAGIHFENPYGSENNLVQKLVILKKVD